MEKVRYWDFEVQVALSDVVDDHFPDIPIVHKLEEEKEAALYVMTLAFQSCLHDLNVCWIFDDAEKMSV